MEITQIMRVGYLTGLEHQVQQKKSKLEATVRRVEQTGVETAVDRLGERRPQKRTTRHADTPLNSTPTRRRWISSDFYDDAELVDNDDKLKTMGDPTNELSQAAGYGMNREKDYIIYGALFAGSPAGETSASQVISFPSSQIIPANNTGMTLEKIIMAKEILADAQVEDDEEKYIVCTEQQVANLLLDPKATSADYVQIKSLLSGSIKEKYLGFNWVPLSSKIIQKSDLIRLCGAYTKSSMAFAKPFEVGGQIDLRPDKNYAVQVYWSCKMGAVRLDETGVVQVQCKERA